MIVASLPRQAAAPEAPALSRAQQADAELARQAQGGDQRSFEALVERHGDMLFRFILRRVGNRHDAEEIVQEAMLRAWASIGRYSPRWRFSTWLCTIAWRHAVDETRRCRIIAAPIDSEPVDVARRGNRAGAASVQADGSDSPDGAGIWSVAARTLSAEEYEALWLRYAADCSAREIGLIVQRNPVAARVMLHRARERLRRALEPGEQQSRGQDQGGRGPASKNQRSQSYDPPPLKCRPRAPSAPRSGR